MVNIGLWPPWGAQPWASSRGSRPGVPGKLTDVVFLLNWRSGKRRRWDAGCA
jgi:hypothetical protein